MRFDIKCSTFVRLAAICNSFEPETDFEMQQQIKTLRLEARNGKIFAICTNQRIAAVEYIAQCGDPLASEVAHVNLHPDLMKQCQFESFLDGVLTINTIPQIVSATATTSSGWAFAENACHWFDDTPLNNWRDWFPKEPVTKSNGVMLWNLHLLRALFESSPTGKIIFPRHIDANKAVVLRDVDNPWWVGLFIPSAWGNKVQKQEAEMPEWML